MIKFWSLQIVQEMSWICVLGLWYENLCMIDYLTSITYFLFSEKLQLKSFKYITHGFHFQAFRMIGLD